MSLGLLGMKMDWIERYKIVRRLSLVWIGWLITHATLAVYADMGAITGPVAAVYGTTTGLLGIIWGKYFYDAAKKDHDKQK